MSAFPFKPYSQLTPTGLLILCSEVITVARWRLARVPSMMSSKGQPCLVLSLQVPGQTSTSGVTSSQLTMRSVCNMVLFLAYMGFLFECLCVLCSERWSHRAPGEGTLWKALSNLAESTRACPRLAWEQVNTGFFSSLCCWWYWSFQETVTTVKFTLLVPVGAVY